MSDLRTAAQQALEALEQSETFVPYEGFGMARREAERKHQAAITALRAALAEPQEPDIAQQVVSEQAEDEGLWFVAVTASEAYLQQALRRLHAAVEGEDDQDAD